VGEAGGGTEGAGGERPLLLGDTGVLLCKGGGSKHSGDRGGTVTH